MSQISLSATWRYTTLIRSESDSLTRHNARTRNAELPRGNLFHDPDVPLVGVTPHSISRVILQGPYR